MVNCVGSHYAIGLIQPSYNKSAKNILLGKVHGWSKTKKNAKKIGQLVVDIVLAWFE